MNELREKADGPNIEPEKSQGANNKPGDDPANAKQEHFTASELKIPQAIIDEYHATQQEQNRKDRKRFCIEVATLIVISLYTAIAGYQGWKMRQATDAAKKRIKDGTMRAFIHGRVTYSDIFGRRHWLTFCSYFDPPDGYAFCNEHNDTDSD